MSLSDQRAAFSLADKKAGRAPLVESASAALWDIDDGVACLEYTGTANLIDDGVLAVMEQALDLVPRHGFRALVLGNDWRHYSAGADLRRGLDAARSGEQRDIAYHKGGLSRGQRAFWALRHASFPVVAAVAGRVIGGGCEAAICPSDAIQFLRSARIGLVECRVGVVPGWGGSVALLIRHMRRLGSLDAAIERTFDVIAEGEIAEGPARARELGYLGAADGVSERRDLLLAEAKARALDLAQDYRPPEMFRAVLPGPVFAKILEERTADRVARGEWTEYDGVVRRMLAWVLTGGDTTGEEEMTEEDLLALERQALAELMLYPKTQERIEAMITRGAFLRN